MCYNNRKVDKMQNGDKWDRGFGFKNETKSSVPFVSNSHKIKKI